MFHPTDMDIQGQIYKEIGIAPVVYCHQAHRDSTVCCCIGGPVNCQKSVIQGAHESVLFSACVCVTSQSQPSTLPPAVHSRAGGAGDGVDMDPEVKHRCLNKRKKCFVAACSDFTVH